MSEKISHEILEQHIVIYYNTLQIAFLCTGGKYFITSNGAFGQRGMGIEEISESDFLKLINP